MTAPQPRNQSVTGSSDSILLCGNSAHFATGSRRAAGRGPASESLIQAHPPAIMAARVRGPGRPEAGLGIRVGLGIIEHRAKGRARSVTLTGRRDIIVSSSGTASANRDVQHTGIRVLVP